MGNRILGLAKAIAWFGWLAFAVFLFAGPFRWELDYFFVHGNRVYYAAAIALLAVVVVFCLAYLPLRGRGLWRWELPVILAFGVGFAAFEHPLGLGISMLLFLGFFTVGHRFARAFRINLETPVETLALAFSVGCAVAIPALFVLGLLHGYYRAVSWILVLAPIALWRRDALAALQAIRKLWQSAREATELRHPLCGIAFVFLMAAAFFSAAGALTPSIAFDTLNFHLPAAQYYSASHRLEPVPMLSYSYYPQGFETLLMVAYQLGGQAAAQLLAPLLFVAFLLLLFAIARAAGLDLAAVVTGLACVAMTPFVLWDGTQTKNDIAMGMFQLAALLCCLKWRNTRERAWLLLGGLFLASSVAAKYTAVYGAIPLLILFLLTLPRMKSHRLRAAGAFLLLLAVLGSYWQVRAFVYTGDPVYPERVERAGQPGGVQRGVRWSKRLTRLVHTAWNLNFEGRPHFESPIRNPLGMFLLTFAPLALLAAWRRDANRRACLFYAGLYLAYWIATIGVLRYALPAFGLIILFLAGKAKQAYDERWISAGGPVRFSIAAALAGSLAFGLLGVIEVVAAPGEFAYLAHRISRDDYLHANLPDYRVLQAIRRLDRNAAVFVADACSRSYAPDPGAFACSGAENARIQAQLRRHAFNFVAVPADPKEQRAGILEGWRAEQIYQDDQYLGYRIAH
ncbi:MAG TPA: glycosyltransferase family 39 protein [Bryobacteraceae bacterium]|nr:glycosyltransferase family 39 protein [Bryobacteraceae bacterium]